MLFTRDGAEFKGTPDDHNGKPVRYVQIACDRCHVIDGQRLWVMGMENGRPYSHTGFSCWTCGNTGVRGERRERLYTEAELARVNKAADTRAARKAEADRVAREQFEAARAAKDAEFRVQNAEYIAKLESLDGEFWDNFRKSFLTRAVAPTERQIELVEGEVAKRAANATSAFIGAVGGKIEVAVTVERVITLPDYGFGINFINLLRSSNGSLLVYKGRSNLGDVGETNTIRATVKAHEWRDGVQQTVIQRPKKVVDTL